MKSYAGIILLLVGLVSSTPLSDDTLTITKEFFPEELAIYSSEYDIVNVFCPLNSLNFDEDIDFESLDSKNIYTFFVEADVSNDKYEYKGLYVLKNKNATKLLDNGRDFTSSVGDESKVVYLAATDGIYVYDVEKNAAEKYGSISESFIGIATPYESEFIYGLTENHVLYKITKGGTEKEVVSDVKDAVQIVVDYENNLFFMDSKKSVFVKRDDGSIKKVKGLPKSPSFAKLIRPPFALETGMPMVAGKKLFLLSGNGTSEFANVILKAKPTAYALDATLIQYYAYEKKIFEYNILKIVLNEIESVIELKQKLETKTDDIKAMGNKSRKSFRPH